MTEEVFISFFTDYLDRLIGEIETKYWEVVDCESDTAVLLIDTIKGPYIINRNIPKRELWMASPISGGSHYYLKESKWLNTRNNLDFEMVLFNELEQLK